MRRPDPASPRARPRFGKTDPPEPVAMGCPIAKVLVCSAFLTSVEG
jgi:hypothetical protein